MELEESKIEHLTAKLSKLSVRNTNKKLRRRDDQITSLKEQLKEKDRLEERLQVVQATSKRYYSNLQNAKNRCQGIAEECKCLKACSRDLNEKIVGLQGALNDIGNEYDCLVQRISQLESNTFETKEDKRKYLDNVRQCCLELLGMNVGIKNVEPVIRCVLKHIASLEVKELPKPTSLVHMLTEMKGLTCKQLAEELSNEDNLTLHSDGTSKFGQHYYAFQISAQDSAY